MKKESKLLEFETLKKVFNAADISRTINKYDSQTVGISITLPLDMVSDVHAIQGTLNLYSRSLIVAYLIHQGKVRMMEQMYRRLQEEYDIANGTKQGTISEITKSIVQVDVPKKRDKKGRGKEVKSTSSKVVSAPSMTDLDAQKTPKKKKDA